MIGPVTRLFVAGHSDSDGRHLASGTPPWPERSRAWLEQTTGRPAELHTRPFAAMGPRAVSYLLDAIRTVEPDIAIIPLGAYVCTVGLVSESVRARFGARAHRLYLSTEKGFEARTAEGRMAGFVQRGGRRAARAVLGTRTLATVAETESIYADILDGLASMESLQVIAVADARFSLDIQQREPLLHARIDSMYERLRPFVEKHHFVWADLEGALRAAPDRHVFYLPDGLHTTAAFHEVYFSVIREALSATVPAA